MSSFKGKISIDNNVATLNAAGLSAVLEGDLNAFLAYNGQSVSVQGDHQAGVIKNATLTTIPETAMQEEDSLSIFAPAVSAIENNIERLETSGVVSARPGFSKGDSTNPVIVISTKPGEHPEAIPAEVDGIKVEFRTATPLEILRGPVPLSAWKRSMQEAAPNTHYVPPPKERVELKEMKIGKVTCHVGPDAGWTMLKPFLEGTTESLAVAMYEFYAVHIIDTVMSLGQQTAAKLNMVLQVSSNDKDIKLQLQENWGDRVDFVAASVSGPNRLFNNAYHTKVAVRDSSAFWLSSGNWSPNSQPLLELPNDQFIYNKGNREWHIIVEDGPLAELYEKFILYDMEQARAVAAPESGRLLPDLLIPAAVLQAEARVIQPAPFQPKSIGSPDDKIKVMPLMSPDNYATEVLKLIEAAEKSIYLQFSYINQPSTATFDKIISALSRKIKDRLDVKIIVGTNQKPEATAILIGRGWKSENFKRQSSKLHNKGILIDGKIAGVGSNNWSNDGTQYNRDTTLIFYSKEVTEYYTRIFEFDWLNLCKPITSEPEIMPIIAPDFGPTPLGMVRIPWQAWYDE